MDELPQDAPHSTIEVGHEDHSTSHDSDITSVPAQAVPDTSFSLDDFAPAEAHFASNPSEDEGSATSAESIWGDVDAPADTDSLAAEHRGAAEDQTALPAAPASAEAAMHHEDASGHHAIDDPVVDSAGTAPGATASAEPDQETSQAHEFVPESNGLDTLNQEFEPVSFPGFDEFNGIHGTPIEDLSLWEQQQAPFSCAVATTDMLFRSYGFDVGEPLLASLFQSRGIYDPAMGTDVHQIAAVVNEATQSAGLHLEAVEINHFSEANLEALLDHGVRPLVGVNSAELYDPGVRFLNAIGVVPDTGHAVQLTGIIRNEQGTFAVINDPGLPGGGGQVLPMDLFLHAAAKMDNDAVVLVPA